VIFFQFRIHSAFAPSAPGLASRNQRNPVENV